MANDWSQAASAAVTQMGNYAITAASNRRQYKNQVKAMELQLDQNKQLWDYQNAYNSPQAQMARLQEAGLNPRLIYGSGAGGAGNASPIQPAEVPTRQVAKPEVPDIMLRHLQMRQMDAQYEATRQSIDQMRTKAGLTEVQTALSGAKLAMESARIKHSKSLAQSEESLQRFAAHRSKELHYNEQRKGELMDQLMEVRGKQMTSMDLDNAFKANRNELAKWGVYQSDSPILRTLMQATRRMGVSLEDLLKEGKESLQYLFKK